MVVNASHFEVIGLISDKKYKAKKIAKTGFRAVGGIFVLLLKIIGTLVLICLATGLIFACIFTVYVNTNLTSELDISLEDQKKNESSFIYYKDLETNEYKKLVTIQSDQYRKWVDYKDIPKYAEHALVAIEDKRFYEHDGVDWYRTSAAFVNMFLSMKDNFGGSTITQQLIKTLTGDDEVTVQRKLLEIFRSLRFEKKYTEEEIIEWYLNVVYFGGNCYGLGAAADYYFGKDVKDLTLAECASIIGITNNPSLYNPYINKKSNKERQELILQNMFEQQYIDEKELKEAVSQPLVFRKGENNSNDGIVYTWFEEAVIEDVIADLMKAKNISRKTATDILFTNGLRIYSTLNPDIQAKVDSIYQDLSQIPEVGGSSQPLSSSIIVADPYTGEILAMEGNVGVKTANLLFNRATQSRRPPGSSIKPLSVYAPAIEYNVITPETRFEDTADVRLKGTTWMPKNDDFSYSGVINVRTAVIRSKNTIAAQIIDMLTPDVSYDFLTNKLGIKLNDLDKDYAPLALGQLTNGITVREMASAYTMFTNKGVVNHLITYTKVLASDNKTVVLDNKPETTIAISEKTAYWVTSMLRDAVNSGTGTGANLGKLMPVAGKTGTTTDNKDRWFAGYTPYYVAVVWTGFDTPARMKVNFNPAARLWKNVMTLIHEGLEWKDFSKLADTYLPPITGVDAEVPYIIRGINILDDTAPLYEITDKTAIKGKNITEIAHDIPGYEIVGESEKTITITDDLKHNIFVFLYKPIDPSPPVEPSEEPTGEPTGEPTSEPTAEPSEPPQATDSPPPAFPSPPESPSPSIMP